MSTSDVSVSARPPQQWNPTSSVVRNNHNVEAIVGYFCRVDLGDLVPHAVLRSIVGLKPDENKKLYDLVASAREVLRKKHHRFIDNERGIGYRVLKSGEEINLCTAVYLQGRKRIRKSVEMVNSIDLQPMPDSARSAAIDAAQRLGNFYALLGSPRSDRG